MLYGLLTTVTVLQKKNNITKTERVNKSQLIVLVTLPLLHKFEPGIMSNNC